MRGAGPVLQPGGAAQGDIGAGRRGAAGRPGIAEVRVDRGLRTIRVERPGDLLSGIVEEGARYGAADPQAVDAASQGVDVGTGTSAGQGWVEWPRTFENPGFCVRYAYA